MGILDRFKTQPKWKHADAAVRLAGVHELPEGEQDVLAEVARTDDDARVRKAAVGKLGTVGTLAEILRADADESVRDQAAGVLLDIALGAFEADQASSLAALDAFGVLPAAAAQKQIVLVAKTAKRESVSQAALGRLADDPKALATVARRSEHAPVRMSALGRLSDADEIAATALKSSFRDVATAALERVTDRAAVKAIATRAANPAAARRARVILRAFEELDAAAAKAEAAQVAAAQTRRRGQVELLRELERAAAQAGEAGAADRIAALGTRWQTEGADADADLRGRFDQALGAAREALALLETQRAAREQRQRETVEKLAARRALVARCRGMGGDTDAEAQAVLVAEWEGLPVVDHPDGAHLQSDFESALRGIERKRKDEAGVSERLARVVELAAALETLSADQRYPASRDVRQRARRVRQDARAAVAGLEVEPRAHEAVARVKAAEEALAAREQAWRDAQNAEAEQRKRRAQQAVQRITDLEKLETPSLKALERAIADALALETELGHEPVDAERQELRRQLSALREQLQPKAAELREADDWQRWANAGVQEQLIEKMAALAAEADANLASRKMRELQEQWKSVASAPRDTGEQLWTRFRAAAQAVRERVEPLRAAQHTQQIEHRARKVAICEQADALADSTDWIATADALKALQAEWKTIGPAPRRDEQVVWDRFRIACTRFFTRRQDDLKQRKQVWTANLETKDALIARAEALATVTDFTAGFAELKALQAEWKASGPVKKAKSEQVWQKFRAACDAFMERYRTRDTQQFADRLARREAVAVDLEALASGLASGAASHEGLLERVRSIRTGWQQAGSVPREVLRGLASRFDTALGAVLTAAPDVFRHSELDAEANRAQLQQLCERVEQVASQQPAMAGASSMAQLADHLRERLAANTIGGHVDDEAKWKNHEFEVRAAQDAWQRVGYVPESVAAPLAARFQRAAHRFYGEKKPGAPAQGPPRGRK
ncbi:MAG: DUF349 domain-containing protein [Vicinamibacteria bacterium]|nr:DUF349 domain-containing protein [Vicinamibacteria bacterium]